MFRRQRQVCIRDRACTSSFSLDFFLENKSEEAKLQILIGVDLPSDLKTLEKLKQLDEDGKLDFRIFTKGFFHPKLYLLEGQSFSKYYGGLGNFTK